MKITRVVTRETDCLERGVPIVIEIHPRELVLRLKGQRQRYAFSYSGIFWAAAKAEAEHLRTERLAAKVARKRLR